MLHGFAQSGDNTSIGKERSERWKKKEYETKTYYKKDEESLKNMEVELMSGIKGNIPFNALMDRMEIAQDRNLKEQKRIKIGKKKTENMSDQQLG